MLYTAVTRAKEKVRIWVTDKSILSKIIENEPKRRRSFLLVEPVLELEDDYNIAL